MPQPISRNTDSAPASLHYDLLKSRFPAWYSAAASGEWVDLPGSTLTSSGVGWAGGSPGGTGNYSTVVTAWGGAVLNTSGVYRSGAFVAGTFLVLFGGGHGDYAGNELYAYGPLEADSPSWSRITDPTIPAPDDVARLSGKPVSRHSYDTLVYLPDQNKMLCIGAPGYYHTGFSFNTADIFDFALDPSAANPWSTADTGFPAFNGGGAGAISLLSGYDSVSGKAWGLGKGNGQVIGSYDAAAGTWASYSKDNPSGPGAAKAGLAGSIGKFVFVNGSTVYVQDLASPTSSIYTPSTTGSAPSLGATAALDWDEAGGRFVVRSSGRTLYYLTPGANPNAGGDAWAWSSVTPGAGATPAAEVANGTYGRFRMVNGTLRGALLMAAHNAPISFYKM